jgi:hypothetical protein
MIIATKLASWTFAIDPPRIASEDSHDTCRAQRIDLRTSLRIERPSHHETRRGHGGPALVTSAHALVAAALGSDRTTCEDSKEPCDRSEP